MTVSTVLTLLAPISQNDQTHSNNLPTNCLSVFDHFMGLALKGLRKIILKSFKVPKAKF